MYFYLSICIFTVTLVLLKKKSLLAAHCSAAYGKSSINVCLFFFTSSMRCDLSALFLLVAFLQEEQGAVQAALLSGAGLHSGKLDSSGVLLLGQRGTKLRPVPGGFHIQG